MKYMLLLRFPRGGGPQEGTPEFDEEMKVWGAINEELTSAGQMILAAGLELDDAATTVRAPAGQRSITDGPFAETKELLFSAYIIDVADLDAAIDLAARMPAADYGSVEVRPLTDVEQSNSN